jgi:hypothetical protein
VPTRATRQGPILNETLMCDATGQTTLDLLGGPEILPDAQRSRR